MLTVVDTAAFGGSQTQTFSYDALNRLLSAQVTGGSYGTYAQRSYVYNNAGNITSFAGVTYTYPAAGQGRPHALTGTSAGGSFSYNNAGYMASRRDRTGAPTWSYAWRENHKLGQISSSATNDVVTFLYGPDDERVKQSSGPAGDTYDTYYLFPFYQVEQGCFRADVDCDGDVDVLDIQAVAGRWNTTYAPFEQNGAAPITTVDVTLVAEKWLWTGGSSTGQVVKTYSLSGRPVAVNRGGEWTYVFQDHLGSPALETDYNGRAGFRWKYEPYGTMRGTEWTLPIDKGFTGQVIEPGLGLHDYGARHYAQPLGRWIAPDTLVPDPMDPQALNRYSYVLNNPLRYNDPSGHDWGDTVDFLLGFGAQWASANAWMAPQAQEALSVQPNESLPMTVGRHLGNVAAIMQGVAEVGVGASVDVGGGGLCLTGVGCLAGAPAVVAGTALAAHGATVAVAGAAMEGQMLGNLVLQANSANQSSKPLQTGGHVINNSTAKSLVEVG